jgi:hypothetical protein
VCAASATGAISRQGPDAAGVSRLLAGRILDLAPELLRGGKREGHEWRAGSLAGEKGYSLGVHLSGHKAGLWSDFATGDKGDALDLVRAVLRVDMSEALSWSRRWLGIGAGEAVLPQRPMPAKQLPPKDPPRWQKAWAAAAPIAGTIAEAYLAGRGLAFADPEGRVLRFAATRWRRSPDGQLEKPPALLAALSDAVDGEQCGVINIFLEPSGADRLRDRKGKTVTGRQLGAVVMLSGFEEPTDGLVLCEGVETGIAIYQQELRPIWACGGTGLLTYFPVLGGIEALTIAADADSPGKKAAAQLAERWRQAEREVVIVAPPAGDWADG